MTDINQCDGCRVGAPLSERGNHIMPDGGYMGCTKDRYAASNLPEIRAELRWCIDNGTYGPRTGAALQWALEALDTAMTDDDARATLLDCDQYIDDGGECDTGMPDWTGGTCRIDGHFSADELRALLHFAPSDPLGPS